VFAVHVKENHLDINRIPVVTSSRLRRPTQRIGNAEAIGGALRNGVTEQKVFVKNSGAVVLPN
jgi:hypothetical protein